MWLHPPLPALGRSAERRRDGLGLVLVRANSDDGDGALGALLPCFPGVPAFLEADDVLLAIERDPRHPRHDSAVVVEASALLDDRLGLLARGRLADQVAQARGDELRVAEATPEGRDVGERDARRRLKQGGRRSADRGRDRRFWEDGGLAVRVSRGQGREKRGAEGGGGRGRRRCSSDGCGVGRVVVLRVRVEREPPLFRLADLVVRDSCISWNGWIRVQRAWPGAESAMVRTSDVCLAALELVGELGDAPDAEFLAAPDDVLDRWGCPPTKLGELVCVREKRAKDWWGRQRSAPDGGAVHSPRSYMTTRCPRGRQSRLRRPHRSRPRAARARRACAAPTEPSPVAGLGAGS